MATVTVPEHPRRRVSRPCGGVAHPNTPGGLPYPAQTLSYGVAYLQRHLTTPAPGDITVKTATTIIAASALLLTTAATAASALPAAGTTPQAAPARPATAPIPLADLVAKLPVVPDVDFGYSYAGFAVPAVDGKDARGCGKRERVLIASAVSKPRVGPGCSLSGGSWRVNQGTRTVTSARAIDVVPVMSAKTAWDQGAFGWTNAQRRSFLTWYQSPARECAVPTTGTTQGPCGYVLQTKALLTPQITDLTTQPTWRPTCPEVAAAAVITAAWGLSLDPSAANKMSATAETCKEKVRVRAMNTRNPIKPTADGNPFLAPGTSAKVWRTDEVLNAPAGPPITSELFGLHIPDIYGPKPTLDYQWLRLWDAKTGWEPLEQTRGVYYWKWIDDAIAYSEAQGKKVIYVFGDTPAWAGPNPPYPPTSLDEFRRYVDAIVSRYGARIDAYQVWNEPNFYVEEAKSLANLVDMTQVVHDAVKGRGLPSLVLAPSTTMRTGTAVGPYFNEYLQPLGERGWPVDGFTVHTYPRAAGGPQQQSEAIAKFQALLDLTNAPNLPVWNTEVNYGLAGLQEPKREITGTEAQAYLIQTFVDSVRSGITQVDWYLWFPTFFPLLGIQTNPTTTETNAAWKWVHDQLVGSSLKACATHGEAVICGFTKGGRDFAIAYTHTGQPIEIEIPKGLTQVCSIAGECRPIKDTLTAGELPQLLK